MRGARYKYPALAALSGALLFGAISPSFANHCCDRWGNVGALAFVQAGMGMAKSFTSMATSLAEILWEINTTWGQGFTKHVSELAKQTAAEKVFWEGRLAVDSQLFMQERAAEAANNAVPPAQQALTMSNAAMLGDHYSSVRAKLTKLNKDFSDEFYGSAAADSIAVFKRHEPYCSGTDFERGRCAAIAAPTIQNADLSINTVFNPGEGQYETLSDDEVAAARALVKNLVQPIPESRPSAAQANTDQGKTLDAQLLADQAALSLAANSLHASIVHRVRRHQW